MTQFVFELWEKSAYHYGWEKSQAGIECLLLWVGNGVFIEVGRKKVFYCVRKGPIVTRHVLNS